MTNINKLTKADEDTEVKQEQMITKIVNLTSHPLNIVVTGEVIPKGTSVAKVSIIPKVSKVVNGIPIYEIEYVYLAGLPEPEENTIYVVSSPVLDYVNQHFPERTDVAAPYKHMKDASGRTIACGGFRING
jgi:hypothetical protein